MLAPTGDFSKATVHLKDNQLTLFESGVFKNMLEQMSLAKTGLLYLGGSKTII